jgi:hypothetical protein
MTNLATYCDTCDHKAVCKIRTEISNFDQTAKDFETRNNVNKLTIISVNYSCVYKEPID